MYLATGVEPTKLTALTSGWWSRASTLALSPWMRFRTPGGSPASWRSSMARVGVSGTFSEGLRTNVLPQAMAKGYIHRGTMAGKLKGVMPAQTPMGWRMVLQHNAGDGVQRVHVGQADGFDGRAERLGAGDGAAHRRFHVLMQALKEEAFGKTDAQAADGAMLAGQVIHYRVAGRSGVEGIVAGDGVQGERGVAHGARERAHVVLAETERQDAKAADAPIGRLESDGAAKRGRDANGAAGIGAHRHEDHVRGYGGARTTARPAGTVPRVPRIAHRAEVRVGRSDAVSQFVHVELAEQYGACGQEFLHHGGVALGQKVLVDLGARGGRSEERRVGKECRSR